MSMKKSEGDFCKDKKADDMHVCIYLYKMKA